MKRLPVSCPSCGGDLAVRRLCCAKCQTEIEGLYPLPPLAGFSPDDQEFILEFIKASGSLKDMRNRLDDIIRKLRQNEVKPKEKK
jgi:hypothetical protein